jgi:hypothetical protein
VKWHRRKSTLILGQSGPGPMREHRHSQPIGRRRSESLCQQGPCHAIPVRFAYRDYPCSLKARSTPTSTSRCLIDPPSLIVNLSYLMVDLERNSYMLQ